MEVVGMEMDKESLIKGLVKMEMDEKKLTEKYTKIVGEVMKSMKNHRTY